jgi:hypothetical protein
MRQATNAGRTLKIRMRPFRKDSKRLAGHPLNNVNLLYGGKLKKLSPSLKVALRLGFQDLLGQAKV